MLSLCIDECVNARLDRAIVERLRARLERMVLAVWLSEKTEREIEADFRITDDRTIHQLNREYRGKDSPTDVLAFAQRDGDGGMLFREILGDIVISLDTVERQAKVGVFEELLFLATHGLCHLLGYDHQDDTEEQAMNTRMELLLHESSRTGPIVAA